MNAGRFENVHFVGCNHLLLNITLTLSMSSNYDKYTSFFSHAAIILLATNIVLLHVISSLPMTAIFGRSG